MSTIVFVHAHPDDEASQTSGTMARAVAEGHRVVCIYATGGDHGSRPDGFHADVSLAEHRRTEAEASARTTGVHRLVWLGFADSGMTGWETNSAPDALFMADAAAVGHTVAAILDEEDADAVVGYDWHGGYGHPDHIMVHRITRHAVEYAARRPRHLEVSLNRDHLRSLMQLALAQGMLPDGEDVWDVDAPADDGNPIGTPEAELAWSVDVTAQLPIKRQALAAHASQTDAASLLALPDEAFAAMFGRECYLEAARGPGMVDGWPFG